MILATVSSSPDFHAEVRTALDSRFRFEHFWNLNFGDAARLRGVPADGKCICIVDFIVDFGDESGGLRLARSLTGRPQIAIIAANAGSTREELIVLMRAGVRDALPQFSARDLLQAVDHSFEALGASGEILADLFAFVPAKPGCGATTIATHAAGMASCLAEEPTLLMDFDIPLGVTTFLLKAEGTRTITDALEMVHRLDAGLWSNLVSQVGNLHLLGSGAGDFSHSYPTEHYAKLLDFALRQYSTVAVDLPGSMEDQEREVLMRAKRILLICTPDIGAMHIARRKSEWLRDLQLSDKVSVVVNCMERRNTLSVQDIERIVQLPARYLLPVGTKDVAQAVQKGEILNPECPLGRQIAAIAREMVPTNSIVKKPSTVRRFVEYFSISQTREARGH
jgi:pilus assembly protein CpaE